MRSEEVIASESRGLETGEKRAHGTCASLGRRVQSAPHWAAGFKVQLIGPQSFDTGRGAERVVRAWNWFAEY